MRLTEVSRVGHLGGELGGELGELGGELMVM